MLDTEEHVSCPCTRGGGKEVVDGDGFKKKYSSGFCGILNGVEGEGSPRDEE